MHQTTSKGLESSGDASGPLAGFKFRRGRQFARSRPPTAVAATGSALVAGRAIGLAVR